MAATCSGPHITNTSCRKCGQRRNPLAIYFVNAQRDRMKIFGSAWVEPTDISKALIMKVLASAFRTELF
jgi:hypothetical protein